MGSQEQCVPGCPLILGCSGTPLRDVAHPGHTAATAVTAMAVPSPPVTEWNRDNMLWYLGNAVSILPYQKIEDDIFFLELEETMESSGCLRFAPAGRER